jgi:CRP/FNR family cyclic AMP-dependent transcriptional regulator
LFGRNAAPDALHPLRQIRLFSSLNRRELIVVQALRHERRYLAGEIVFDEGDEGEAIYAIVSGEIEILRADGERQLRLALAGRRRGLRRTGAAGSGAACRAGARRAPIALLVVFFRADFMNLLETHPKVASKIALVAGAPSGHPAAPGQCRHSGWTVICERAGVRRRHAVGRRSAGLVRHPAGHHAHALPVPAGAVAGAAIPVRADRLLSSCITRCSG